ncbi:hypothetical protein [Thermomonospora umbrina]|nr:hypothetical protein [Thermomonospora umbrina]
MAPDALLKHLTPAIGAHLFDFRDRRLATLFPVATVIGDISSPLEAQSLLIDILASRERGLDRAGPATDPRLGDRQMQLLGVELLELLSAWYGGSPAEVHHGVQPALDRLTRTDVAVMPGLRAPTASRLDTPAGGGPRTSHAPGGFPVDRPHLPPPRRTGPRP